MRSRRRGVAFSLDKDAFIVWYCEQPRECTYCGIPEMHERFPKSDAKREYRLQVDRKDNTLGYELANLTLACPRCNTVKSDVLTFDEMLFMGRTFIRPKWDGTYV
jgi:5-methylcytosine-specific restriction endonuclease McrA